MHFWRFGRYEAGVILKTNQGQHFGMKTTKEIAPLSNDASPTSEMEETTAMLALIAQAKREMAEGKVMSVERAFEKVRASMSTRSM